MLLEAKNISFRYGKDTRQILEDFSLSVESHERVGIIAPSGFGKTTFCKILAGYEKPDSGEVLLDGMRKVLEEGQEIEERIIRGLGIEDDWMNRYPGELSGGELQRFCIARALGKGTKFILADEITTMLDLITQSQLWSFLIKEVQEREIGLLAVSHHMPLMQSICTRMVELDKK